MHVLHQMLGAEADGDAGMIPAPASCGAMLPPISDSAVNPTMATIATISIVRRIGSKVSSRTERLCPRGPVCVNCRRSIHGVQADFPDRDRGQLVTATMIVVASAETSFGSRCRRR